MNIDSDNIIGNSYEGNGWSKYQMLVLQQLKDHNSVLQNLNKEIIEVKQLNAVADAESKMWKIKVMSDIESLRTDVDKELYEENGLHKRLSKVERDLDLDDHLATKSKATLALYGSIAMFVLNALIQIIAIYLNVK